MPRSTSRNRSRTAYVRDKLCCARCIGKLQLHFVRSNSIKSMAWRSFLRNGAQLELEAGDSMFDAIWLWRTTNCLLMSTYITFMSNATKCTAHSHIFAHSTIATIRKIYMYLYIYVYPWCTCFLSNRTIRHSSQHSKYAQHEDADNENTMTNRFRGRDRNAELIAFAHTYDAVMVGEPVRQCALTHTHWNRVVYCVFVATGLVGSVAVLAYHRQGIVYFFYIWPLYFECFEYLDGQCCLARRNHFSWTHDNVIPRIIWLYDMNYIIIS